MDPQQQQQVVGMMAGMGVAIAIIWLLAWVFFIFLFWRVFSKAGMSGALGLIAILPGLGWIICMCILAFARWNVAPLPPGYGALPQAYPPPPVYTSTSYPPQGPPTQL